MRIGKVRDRLGRQPGSGSGSRRNGGHASLEGSAHRSGKEGEHHFGQLLDQFAGTGGDGAKETQRSVFRKALEASSPDRRVRFLQGQSGRVRVAAKTSRKSSGRVSAEQQSGRAQSAKRFDVAEDGRGKIEAVGKRSGAQRSDQSHQARRAATNTNVAARDYPESHLAESIFSRASEHDDRRAAK